MTVTLSAYALGTVPEVMEYLSEDSPADKSPVNSLLNRATSLIETYLSRELVTRGSLTEFHSIPSRTSRLLLLEAPIISITTVHEDQARGYGASTLLVDGTDFISSDSKGELIRVQDGGGDLAWQTGFRAVQAVYDGGYATAQLVPDDIRDAFFEVCAWLHAIETRKKHGISGWSDDAGNYTRVSTDHLPKHLKGQLASHRRFPLGLHTGERD